MLCRIAELLTEIPATDDMIVRCREYLTHDADGADIVIRAELYKPDMWEHLSEDDNIYLQSGFMFYRKILRYNGLMMHSSAVEMEGRAYLFSGPCGMGKSTHTRLWQQVFGDKAQVFNDDKPALRRLEDRWYAYGTPWCGKDGINQNKKVPLGGICFLRRGEENSIRRLEPLEATKYILSQTTRKLNKVENLDLLISHVDKLVTEIPIYELFNKPVPEAAQLSYETMRRGAQEAGL